MSQIVPILVYHHVYPDGHPELAKTGYDRATGLIAESDFRRHMGYIADEGWVSVSTTLVVDWLDGKASLPERAVALHFDNGWPDALTVAAPILGAYGMAGISYVITEPTEAASEGRPAMIRTATEGAVEKPFLTWNDAGELLSQGWEIGAHTHSHPKLADVRRLDGDDEMFAEIDASDALFRKHLGFVPDHFAYPSGSRDEGTDALLAPRYRSLRRWSFSHPPEWEFTDITTPPSAIECQNVDSTVSFEDFQRIFTEAAGG